ncbi:MAG: beta-ketoacyl-[acyl-carrier-protein] synthase family protein [Chloroflexi bacterium]|nr:beta-ketoacyl-[acyl-carrier-protein] synthase family protein [Chloroflexota bacterium]
MDHNEMGTDRTVVVTGMGVICPNGQTVAEFYDALSAGRSGITHWKHRSDRIGSKIGGDMSEFDFAAHLKHAGRNYPDRLKNAATVILRSTPLAAQLAVAAALQAFVDAELPDPALPPDRFGHILGGTNLNAPYILQNATTFNEEPDFIEPLYGVMVLDTDVLARVCDLLTLKGPSWTVGNACGSANIALITGMDMIRSGRADAVVVTATSGALDPMLLHSWATLGALSSESFNEEATKASRPFDRRREGFVPSEGSAAVVLETLGSARRRGKRIHAKLLGGGASSDATRQIRPSQEGQMRAMRAALEDARINPEQVDYVNAHATSTQLGDLVEVSGIKAVLGDHAYEIPVNSTKSMTGHLLYAAALVELVATILEMENNFVHPTINLDAPDDGLDLDFVPNQAREHRIRIAMSNSFGFGGLNSCLVLERGSN